MLRLKFMQGPPASVKRGESFPVKLNIVNEVGIPLPNLPGMVQLTAQLLDGHSRKPVPGAPILEVKARGGGTGKKKNDAKCKDAKSGGKFLTLEPNGEAHLTACIATNCNGIHYSGNTHTDTCYHVMKWPMVIEFNAKLKGGSGGNKPAVSRPSSAKGSKKAASKGKGKEPPTPAPPVQSQGVSFTVLPVTSVPIVVVPAGQKEVKREDTVEAGGDTNRQSQLQQAGCSRVVEFVGKQLVVEEWPSNTAACTGAIVWDNALLLCQHMQELGKKVFWQRRVVDIGCGTGLVGLCACLFGAHAILTDLEGGAALADRNVIANAQLIRAAGGTARVVRHCWGEDSSAITRGGPIDILIACEVVYNNDAFAALIQTLCELCSPKTMGLLALRKRHGCDIDLFLEMLGEHFKIDSKPLASSANGVELTGSDVSKVKHPPKLYTIFRRDPHPQQQTRAADPQ